MSFSVFSQNPTVINDSLVVNQRLYAKEKLVVDQEAKFKQDIKVLGTARVSTDLIVDGTTKLNGNVKMENIGVASGITSENSVLVILPNGQVKSLTLGQLMTSASGPTPEINFCLANGGIAQWWAEINKIYTACPNVNVGIRTNVPIHALHTAGTTYAETFLAGNKDASYNALFSGYSFTSVQPLLNLGIKHVGNPEEVRFSVANNGEVIIDNIGAGPGLTINNGNGHALVIYSDNGNKILQVEDNGLLRAREVRIDATTWADFVFDEEYELPKLHDVAKYIELNHHLPGVPTSADIKENGINVAEIQTMQMQKIEELTLYMIEMNQRMDSLQVEVNRLKQENQELKKSGTK